MWEGPAVLSMRYQSCAGLRISWGSSMSPSWSPWLQMLKPSNLLTMAAFSSEHGARHHITHIPSDPVFTPHMIPPHTQAHLASPECTQTGGNTSLVPTATYLTVGDLIYPLLLYFTHPIAENSLTLLAHLPCSRGLLWATPFLALM
jgi:hypothetical protein